KASQALDVLKTLTTDEPGNVKAWRLLGETQASLGRAPEAIVALERAVALGVPEGEVARLLGLALLRSAREADAVALCRRVTDTRVAEGDPDAGIAYCRDLLAESPQSVELHAHLASLLEGLGRAEEARAALQALAALHEAANRSDAAVETYRRLLILDPSDATANDRLMALEPPAPVATEPPPVPVPDETVPASAEPVESPPAEEIDASLSSLEELGLSLGSEDAALLLEESSEPLPETIPDPSAVPADAGDTGETAVEDEMLQGTDWLTQELHAIDLEQTAPDGPPAGTEWGPRKPSLEVEDISAVLEGTPLSGIGGGTASDPAASAALAAEELPLVDLPVVELSDGPADRGASLLDLPASESPVGAIPGPEDDMSSSRVAEQLAEADVYQKYGLEEKARDRLLEAIRLSPENLTARRRLRAIYADRRQIADVCAETLSIARVLRARGDEAAAAAEVRDALASAPDHPDLLQFLGESPDADVRPTGRGAPVLLSGSTPMPARDSTAGQVPRGPSEIWRADAEEAPPPDVPLLLELELEEAVRVLEP
ncbi:MAG: hypothetical protein EHM71_17675, partial [Zetaproteobacteria bacterium]